MMNPTNKIVFWIVYWTKYHVAFYPKLVISFASTDLPTRRHVHAQWGEVPLRARLSTRVFALLSLRVTVACAFSHIYCYSNYGDNTRDLEDLADEEKEKSSEVRLCLNDTRAVLCIHHFYLYSEPFYKF